MVNNGGLIQLESIKEKLDVKNVLQLKATRVKSLECEKQLFLKATGKVLPVAFKNIQVNQMR